MNNLKKNSFSLMAGLLLAPAAMALDTAIVDVSATVAPVCKFVSGGSVTFALDSSSSSDAAGNVMQPVFWCTKGTTYDIADDKAGVFQMASATSGESIPYTFSYTAAGIGQGKSVPFTMDIAATVANSDFIDVSPANDYSDTVTLTINP